MRGFRIELGEIETRLSNYKGIKKAVVLALEHLDTKSNPTGDKYLVAYYASETKLDEALILDYLNNELPEYMIPSVLVHLENLPLTINGKLDRKALPNPKFIDTTAEYIAPRNKLEEEICTIYADVLRLSIDKIGVQDDFFKLGGDSILSIQVSAKLRKSGINCTVKDVFACRTIENLMRYLSHNSTKIVQIKTEQGPLEGIFDLLPIQNWFFAKVASGEFKNYWHWNQSFIIKVPKLDKDRLKRCITELVKQHDILRVVYIKSKQDIWQQCYQSTIELPELKILNINEYDSNEINKILTIWQSKFNIEHGPLFQIAYIYGYPDDSARIYMALHHLIEDTVSWRILTRDLQALCDERDLGSKGSSYRQWVTTIKKYPQNHKLESKYWDSLINSLPDYKTAKIYASTNDELHLPRRMTSQLLKEANQAYSTEINDLLLTALAYTLKDWQGSIIQGITLEGHGRESIDTSIDHNNTVGWFTIMYPVQLTLHDTVRESIKYTKEAIRLIPNKGIGYSCFAVLEDNDISFSKLPPISFNYLGQFDSGQEGNWQIILENSGASIALTNEDSNLININGGVTDGQLKFRIMTKLGYNVTKLITRKFKWHLESIIEHCIKMLETNDQENTPSDFSDFIPFEIINNDIDENPLFILPPGEGGAESYYSNISPQLNDRRLVLFNNFYLYLGQSKTQSAAQNKLTFEELAKYYILQLKNIQPQGPYELSGWSFGGVLSFEIARQLKKSGQEVSRLILFDSFFKYEDAISHISKEANIPQYWYESINYKYTPITSDYLFKDTEVILFKAKKEMDKILLKNLSEKLGRFLDLDDIDTLLFKYYVNTNSNNLEYYISNFKLYEIDCYHYDIMDYIDRKKDIFTKK